MKRVIGFLATKVGIGRWLIVLGGLSVAGFAATILSANIVLQRAVELERTGVCVPVEMFKLSAELLGLSKVGSAVMDDEALLHLYTNEANDLLLVRMTKDREACVFKHLIYFQQEHAGEISL